jgi:uncharacterized damage-inducible protein DinB
MIRFLVLTVLAAASAPAQNPVSADAKALWAGIKNNTLRAAEKVPEEHYSFQPTPDVRTFGQLVAHVADGNYLFCSAAAGETKQMNVEKSVAGKANLLAALKESIAYCDAVYDSLTDAKGAESIKLFGRDRTRAATLFMNVSHDNEHYGNMVTYMRIKGIVPPSSEPRR